MGFDITVRVKDVEVAHERLSSNWCDLWEIAAGPNETKIKIWSIKDDMFGLSSSEVIHRLDRALDILKSCFGVTPATPDFTNPAWGWGVFYTGKTTKDGHEETQLLPRERRLGIFAFHLSRFKEVAERYPSAMFYNSDIYIYEEVSSDEEVETPELAYPYQHPHKGLMYIDTFSKAMQIYGLECAQGVPEELAKKWFNLAWTLPRDY